MERWTLMFDRILLFTSLAALALVLPIGAALMAPVAPEDSPDAPTPAPQDGDCASPASVLASAAYDAAFAHYAAQPGFIDLHLQVEAGRGDTLVALFDLSGRSAPLPPALSPVMGHDVRVVGVEVESLLDARTIEVEGAAASLARSTQNDDRLSEQTGSEANEQEEALGTPCSGRISPGARVSTPLGRCSLNFIFRDSSGVWYAGSAGHCFSGVGDRASVAGLGTIGSVVYNIDKGVGSDFALIRIDAEDVQYVDPSMCHWGGPSRVGSDGYGAVHHYGFGVAYDASAQTRARSGALQSVGSTSFTFAGTVTSGDSGSGARMNEGQTLGAITHVLGVPVGGVAHSTPYVYGTTAPRALALAESGTGLDLHVVTAPVALVY